MSSVDRRRLGLIGGTGWWLWGPRVPAVALVVLVAVALTGAVAHGLIGRTVFLLCSDVHSLDPASFGRQR